MAIKHYYSFKGSSVFGSLLSSQNWDAVRMDPTQTGFAFESSREAYDCACAVRGDYAESTQMVLQSLEEYGLLAWPLVSLGVGKGILEWHLKRLRPELRLWCTDFAPTSVRMLADYLPDMEETFTFDIVNGDYRIFDSSSTLLMYRISTEFSATVWRQIFRKIRAAGIKTFIFVPTEIATFKIKLLEVLSRLKAFLLGRRQVFCGWLYGDSEIRSFFDGYELVEFRPYGQTAVYVFRRQG